MDISPNLNELFHILRSPQRIVIVTHLNPDGDAIGSTMGLYHYLKQFNHQIHPITPTPNPDYLKWVPGAELIIDAETNSEACLMAVKNADFIFCLDFGVLKRTKALEDAILNARAGLINIDHHADFADFTHYKYRDIKASSTCELVYDFIISYSGKNKINADVANCLFLGIMTDTGSFRFRTANAKTFRVAAELLELGANNEKINYHVFNNNSLSRTHLLGKSLSQNLFVKPEYRTAYIVISQEDYQAYNIKDGEIEGIVTFTLALQGINLGILIVEHQGEVKMSFRSVGKFPANELAKKFNGGGHYNAAGGRMTQPLNTVLELLEQALQEYQNELQYEPFSE